MKLRHIPTVLRADAREAIKTGDVEGFFSKTDSMHALELFLDNAKELRKRGLYEKGLLTAWSLQKVTLTRIGDEIVSWSFFVSRWLESCDRQKLLDAGDELPTGDPLTLYRGFKSDDFAKGISWTLSHGIAKSFAGRNGKVHKTTVRRAEVLCYIDKSGREEQEVLVLLPLSHPVEIVGPE